VGRHKQYCEDDVRGLAHIYDWIAETENLMAQAGSGDNRARRTVRKERWRIFIMSQDNETGFGSV